MQKPNKKPREVLEFASFLNIYTTYSPANLRSIADKMESGNILSLKLALNDIYSGCQLTCYQKRIETEEEAEKRFKKEEKEYKRQLALQKKAQAKRKQSLIKEAKKLGLKVVDE